MRFELEVSCPSKRHPRNTACAERRASWLNGGDPLSFLGWRTTQDHHGGQIVTLHKPADTLYAIIHKVAKRINLIDGLVPADTRIAQLCDVFPIYSVREFRTGRTVCDAAVEGRMLARAKANAEIISVRWRRRKKTPRCHVAPRR